MISHKVLAIILSVFISTVGIPIPFLNHKLQVKSEEVVPLKQIVEEYVIVEFEMTAYSPLDPSAKIGVCHDGSPKTTASGTVPTSGRTIAVDPKIIPLGTEVYVQGFGWRIAEDVGGMIKGTTLDMVMDSQKDALEWGRKRVMVAIKKSEVEFEKLFNNPISFGVIATDEGYNKIDEFWERLVVTHE